jgi:predicted anti-sigma-YlaC factor YlaD
MATDYMEGTLGWRQRLRVLAHLAICHGCRAFIQQMRRTVSLLATLPAVQPATKTEAELLGALRRGRPPGV